MNCLVTPLINLANLAHRIGVDSIMVKHESKRFQLNAFKVKQNKKNVIHYSSIRNEKELFLGSRIKFCSCKIHSWRFRDYQVLDLKINIEILQRNCINIIHAKVHKIRLVLSEIKKNTKYLDLWFIFSPGTRQQWRRVVTYLPWWLQQMETMDMVWLM